MAETKKTTEAQAAAPEPAAEPAKAEPAKAEPAKKAPAKKTAQAVVSERVKRNAERVRKGRPAVAPVVTHPKARGAK